jgi:hypothetical protein
MLFLLMLLLLFVSKVYSYLNEGNIERAKNLLNTAESLQFYPDVRFSIFLRKNCLDNLVL